MATKIFISHSAKSKADQVVLDKLRDDLIADGYEPWVDRERLKVGANWNQDITDALRTCHAAIVLFSEQALKSDFVKYEVSTLIHRKRSQTSFGLFPVTIDNIELAKLERDFYGAIKLTDFQVEGLTTAYPKIVCQLDKLDPSQSAPTNAIEGMLLQIFEKVSPAVLLEAANDITWEFNSNEFGWDDLTRQRAVALAFVRWLLAQELTMQIRALRSIGLALPPDQDLGYVFERVAPWWVNDKAAQRLCAAQKAAIGKRVAVLNGNFGNWTCNMFLRRVRPTAVLDKVIADDPDMSFIDRSPTAATPTTGDSVGGVLGTVMPAGRRAGSDLVIQIRRALCRRFNIAAQDSDDVTDAKIDAELEDYEVLNIYPIQVVQLDARGLSVLPDLLSRFKRLTIIAMTGQQIPDLPQDLKNVVTIIEPPLSHDEREPHHSEDYAYKWYSRQCAN